MRSVIVAQEQAVRDQQSAQMTNLYQQLQGMGLTPEQQRDYVHQYESAYELQLQQIEQQAEMVEQGYRHINRVCANTHLCCSLTSRLIPKIEYSLPDDC